MQFVTFRLGDSLPYAKLRKWKEERETWLSFHPRPWSPEKEKEYHQRFTKEFEKWLDEGAGSCLLQDSENRAHLEFVLNYDQGKGATHHAWVIMPNHVHLLFTPHEPIERLMRRWKGISARNIGKGSIWQKAYRDTLIRDIDHFINAVRYIRKNPARLQADTFTLWQSERALAIQ